MSISPVTTATAQSTQQSASVGNSLIDSDFETFLVMLTTQMQNQDPMNPIESSDYAVQLATFSGVEQAVRSNQLLENLVQQMGAMGMAQLAGWVGMEARAAAPVWFDGEPVTLAPNPAAVADQAILVTYDSAGTEMSRRPITLSTAQIEWSGLMENGSTAADGLYSFRLESYLNGNIVANDQVEAYSQIVEARGENGGTILVLEGGSRISSDDVTALRAPRG